MTIPLNITSWLETRSTQYPRHDQTTTRRWSSTCAKVLSSRLHLPTGRRLSQLLSQLERLVHRTYELRHSQNASDTRSSGSRVELPCTLCRPAEHAGTTFGLLLCDPYQGCLASSLVERMRGLPAGGRLRCQRTDYYVPDAGKYGIVIHGQMSINSTLPLVVLSASSELYVASKYASSGSPNTWFLCDI